MAPTLLSGDKLIIKTERDIGKSVKRGEIVAYIYKEDIIDIKRVVGLQGDVVEVKENVLYVNDNRTEEPYIMPNEPDTIASIADFPPLTVPDGQVLVLGDNRLQSDGGLFSTDQINGRALYILSAGQENRIGKTLD
jgi:signal peptidase I